VLRPPHPAIGVSVDRGWLTISDALLARYRAAISDATGRAGVPVGVPLGLLLSLRGEPFPSVDLEADTVSVHGGHVLTALAPLRVPGRYRLVGQLDDLFSKNGRSGPLTVIARSTCWLDEAGAAIAVIQDQQIVRRIRSDHPPPQRTSTVGGEGAHRETAAGISVNHAVQSAPEPGDVIAVEHRLAPDPAAVRRYAEWLSAPEPLFVDRSVAQRLGFADVIVPGPLQSALLEDLLAVALPQWTLQALSCTFRISLIAAEPIALRVIATELRDDEPGAVVHLDLTIENSDGERAAIGDAALRRRS
jgi:acyl dehydratase